MLLKGLQLSLKFFTTRDLQSYMNKSVKVKENFGGYENVILTVVMVSWVLTCQS